MKAHPGALQGAKVIIFHDTAKGYTSFLFVFSSLYSKFKTSLVSNRKPLKKKNFNSSSFSIKIVIFAHRKPKTSK